MSSGKESVSGHGQECVQVCECVSGSWACRKHCGGPCDYFGLATSMGLMDMFLHRVCSFLSPPSVLVCVHPYLCLCS